jgi:acyl-ACP thioesterase
MEYSPRHARAFKPRYYEMDDDGEATPTTMMSLFEDTAFSHCESTGWDVFRLREAGYGWVLMEGGFSMDRYPRYKEPFTVETWLEGAKRFYGKRGFEVKDESGATIGRARSLWVFYDLERRRPASILPEILESWRPNPKSVPERGKLGGEAPAMSAADASAFDVRALDIDTNGHVNNVRYLEWALDAIPKTAHDARKLSCIEGRFIHEVVKGQRVTPVSRRAEDHPLAYRLAVYASGDAADANAAAADGHGAAGSSTLAACAWSTWTRRG